MKVVTFDPPTGIYHFELTEIETYLHQHPVVEVVLAKTGSFTLRTATQQLDDLSLAVILPNVAHQLLAAEVELELLILECNVDAIVAFFDTLGIQFEEGIATQTSLEPPLADLLVQLTTTTVFKAQPRHQDTRIQTCLAYLDSSASDYKTMLASLRAQVHLSESRLSHIFKAAMGVSIKKYLLWSRLRNAIALVVHQQLNLYEAALQSGFYDQAHLSKAFKQVMGLNPSLVYNSGTLFE